MIKIKVNKKDFDFPTSASELTLQQFFDLRKPNDTIGEICAILGLDRVTVSNFSSGETLTNVKALINTLTVDFGKGRFAKGEKPKKLFVAGQSIKIPDTLKLEPIGAYMNVYNAMTEQKNKLEAANLPEDYTDLIPLVLAHYFYAPCHHGQLYDEVKAEGEAWMQQIMKLNFAAVLPIANDFFLKYPNWA